MPKAKGATKAINLRIELEHEELVRDTIGKIRSGGLGFRAALQALLTDDAAAKYLPAQEIDARLREFMTIRALEDKFTSLEEQLKSVATGGGEALSSDAVRSRFEALEHRIRALEEERNSAP